MTETVRPLEQREPVDQRPMDERPSRRPEATGEPADQATGGPHRRRWRPGWLGTILIAFLIVATFAGAALGYGMTRPRVYGAEAEILLTPRPELSDAAVDRAMATQLLVAESPSVLQPVAARTGIPLRTLRAAVTAEMVGRSNILRISVADPDRTRAVTVTDLIVAEYSQLALAARVADEPPPVGLTILTPARLLDRLVEPQPWRALAAGTLLGVLFAAAAVFLLRRPRAATRTSPYWT